jgi:hypothetical protein
LHAAHWASIALRRTFDHWVKVGRGVRLLRQKADQIGAAGIGMWGVALSMLAICHPASR